MALSLYEIDREIQEALESALYYGVDEETGEVVEGNFQLLDMLTAAREEKLDNIGCYIKSLTAEVEALDNEKKNLDARIKSKKARLEKLRNYVTDSMLMNGDKKFESARVVFSFRKSEKVDIVDANLLPAEYVTIKTEVNPDKMAIKKAIKAGAEIEGAILSESVSLQVK